MRQYAIQHADGTVDAEQTLWDFAHTWGFDAIELDTVASIRPNESMPFMNRDDTINCVVTRTQ